MIILLVTSKGKFLHVYPAQSKRAYRAFSKKAAQKNMKPDHRAANVYISFILIVSDFFPSTFHGCHINFFLLVIIRQTHGY